MKKTYLDLSTLHLSGKTCDDLDHHSAGYGDWPALAVAPHLYGWFVSVPNLDVAEVGQQLATVPQDLRTVLAYAFRQGAELIRFDADGHVSDDLPFHQEI